MEGRKEGIGRFSVPAFGEWDGKIGVPDYSIDFSRIREHRRQSKSRVSLGNEEELLCNSTGNGNHNSESLQNNQQLPHHKDSSTVFLGVFNVYDQSNFTIEVVQKRCRDVD